MLCSGICLEPPLVSESKTAHDFEADMGGEMAWEMERGIDQELETFITTDISRAEVPDIETGRDERSFLGVPLEESAMERSQGI